MLVRWLINAAAILLLPYLLGGIHVEGIGAALLAAAVLGLLNAVLRPILLVLTLPVNVLTLGLFTFVVNALMLVLAAHLVPGVRIDGFLAALGGSLVLSAVNAIFGVVAR